MKPTRRISRRDAGKLLISVALAPSTARAGRTTPSARFHLRYALASCMYGKMALGEILPEVAKSGASHLDIWPAKHGNQREQVEAMGYDQFVEALEAVNVKLGIITRYDLGPFRLQEEINVASRLGATLIVTGSPSVGQVSPPDLKSAIAKFVARLMPLADAAERAGVRIGIENHGHSLVDTPDSLRWFADAVKSTHVGIALAPYHLPQDPGRMATLMRDLGPRLIHFYAWQHGLGCDKQRPKSEEILQLPGRGDLDFVPLMAALRAIDYRGWTEIFMHPVPRGIPILPSASEVTAEINRARRYLESCLPPS